jgi:Ca-activated chloride channel family protein
LSDISFLHLETLWAAPAVVLAFVVWRMFRRHRFVSFSAVRQFQTLRHHPSPVRRMPTILTLLALGMIFVGLMEPVLPYLESRIEARGLDIVLVMDLSSSMLETMGENARPSPIGEPAGPGTRLAVTKAALRDFIRGRRDDRIGLVVFASNAYVISPLTFDYDYLLRYVDDIQANIQSETNLGQVLESGTAIGEGIYMAGVLLARQSEADVKNKVIVVLTDGEYNMGRDPVKAVGDTDAAGVRVHLIGLALEHGVKEKPAVLDLIHTVTRHGGQYFEANTAGQLQAAQRALGALERGHLAGRRFELNVPVFAWFAGAAVVLIVAALGMRMIPYFADLT